MSNVERKNRIFKIILISAAAGVLLLLAVFLPRRPLEVTRAEEGANLPFENIKIEYKNGEKLSFSLKLGKGEMKSFLKEKGVDVPAVFSFLPDELEMSGEAEINLVSEDGYVSVLLLEANINGFDIPQKLLSDIGQIKLDFKRSLVYN